MADNDKPIMVRCPDCGFLGNLLSEDFQVLGADEDKVFCGQCLTEFNPNSHVVNKQKELFL